MQAGILDKGKPLWALICFPLFCAVFLFFVLAAQANAATIDGSSWPTSGAASAGTTGFSAVTGGTHVGSTDIPPGSVSTGYITGADNTTMSFRVDGTSVPLQTDNDYWVRYWVKAARNGTALAADNTLGPYHYVISGSTKLNTQWYLRNDGVTDGFGILVSEFLPGGTSTEIWNAVVSNVKAILPFDQWGEITIHIHKDGKDGEYAVYLNRSLIRLHKNIATLLHTATFTVDATADTVTSTAHGMVEGEMVTLTTTGTLPAGLATGTTYYVRNPTTDAFQLSLTSGGVVKDITDTGTGTHTYTNGGIALASLGSQWLMSFGGVNGITWQIAGSVSTSSVAAFTNTPLVDTFASSTDWITKVYPSAYNNLTYGGDFWQKTAGAMSVTATSYGSIGAVPQRERFVLSGSAADTATIATTIDIGDLPYNSFGWATLFFPMIYLPDSGQLNIVVKNPGGSSIYQVDIDSSYLKQNGVNLAPWTQGDRYFLALHFSNTGLVNYSFHDLTANVDVGQNFWSGQLANWTPQTMGRVQYTATRGTTNLELDGLAVARWLPLFGFDSLTEAPVNLLTPIMAGFNHIPYALAPTRDESMLPGSVYAYRANSLPRFFVWGIVGRSGRKRQHFTDNILPYMTYSRGIVMTNIDGGSINEIATINSDESARTTVVNTLISQLTQEITQLTGNFNRVWLTTMINRVQGSTYTATERNAILDFDTGIRNLWQSYPSTYLSDPATDIADPSTLFTAGDDTHFNGFGDLTYTTNMVNDMLNVNVTPFVTALGPSTLVNGSTTSNTTPTFTFVSDDGNEDLVRFELQIDDSSDFSSPVEDFTSSFAVAGSSSHIASSLPSASYYWRVRASDGTATSSWSQANGVAVAFVLDATPSTVVITAPAPAATVRGATVFTFTSSEPGTQECNINGGAWESCASGDVFSTLSSFAGLGEAAFTLNVRDTDAVGNVGSDSESFVKDTTAPSAPVIGSVAGDTSTPGSSSDSTPDVAISGITSGDTVTVYDTDGTTVVGTFVASATTGTVTLSALSEAAHTLTTKAIDLAGNTSTASNAFVYTYDNTPPSAPVITPGVGSYTSVQNVAITSAGADSVRYTIDGTDPSCTAGTLYAGTFTLSSSATVKAAGCDLALNVSSVASKTYTITINTGGGGAGGTGAIALFNYTNLPSSISTAANLSLTFVANTLVKLPNDGKPATQQDSAVYYYGRDGRRHALPNDKVFFTWYSDFSHVQIISATELERMPLGQNVTYRPGVKMVKFTTLSRVYAVDAGGLLRWVKTEAVATALYGSTWNRQIDDISDAFFSNYRFGNDINGIADFNPTSVTAAASSIQVDMGF